MARKLKKQKLKLKRSQVIKKTEENFDYHMFDNALMFLQARYMDYFIPKRQNPVYDPKNKNQIVDWHEVKVKTIKDELLRSFDFLIPIINITIRASIRVFADQNARENVEILNKSVKLKKEFGEKLKENMSEYATKYIKNITSAYKEVETAFAKILEVFACYDIMSVYIDKAQLKAENKRYCKMMLTKWKKFKEQCIKLIEEDEYNPRKQLKDLLEYQKQGNRVDKKILNKLMIDSKKFA
jgi:hypothetical protein